MNQRIIGFDLARAYAIFGMFIVNYSFSFGSIMAPTDSAGYFMSLFTGNSTAIFIICAGIGVSLLSANKTNLEEQKKLKSKILKRSWFLFGLGLLLFPWWSGDILHFYGGYLHFAAFILFIDKKYYLIFGFLAILIFHSILFVIPIEKGWDFTIFKYTDFWSIEGFLRNTFYNGWNSMFPWLSYFFLGMFLGKLDWQKTSVKIKIFLTGLFLFLGIQTLRYFAKNDFFSLVWKDYIMAEYYPPYLPFILLTMAFALMVISFCIFIGEKFSKNYLIQALSKTGQMTLTHYVLHLTLGVIIFAFLNNKTYTGYLEDEIPTKPYIILSFSVVFYIFCVVFSVIWTKKFKKGPLEMLMRKISG